MLAFMRIGGLAVIDRVELELGPGLSVLTGETGAGKSILVGALSLLRGDKLKGEAKAKTLIRSDAERASVEAQFVVGRGAQAISRIEQLGLLDEHSDKAQVEVLLGRAIPRQGKVRNFIQGQLSTQAQLNSVGECLIDICSQHEQHSLARLGRHLELLDEYASKQLAPTSRGKPRGARPGFGELNFAELLCQYKQRFAELKAVDKELGRVAEFLRRDPALAGYLEHQLTEIERVAPAPGEWESLAEQIQAQKGARERAELGQLLDSELLSADGALLGRLYGLERQLRIKIPGGINAGVAGEGSAERSLAQAAEQLALASEACERALELTRGLVEAPELESDLEVLLERQHELASLRRKHGEHLAEVQEKLERELHEWRRAASRMDELEAERGQLLTHAAELARVLHQRRLEIAARLMRALEQELAQLHMPHARIEIRVDLLSVDKIHGAGLSRVEFCVAANPGEPAGPLNQVASGGELSRILLALQSVLQGQTGFTTYIFDEVDAGVGGAVADAIGRRLAAAAHAHEGAQVLCITHLPQVAAFADAHYVVEKLVASGRTSTVVRRLDEEERVLELARMLGGANVNQSAREHARRLLEAARAGGGAEQRLVKAALKSAGRGARPRGVKRATGASPTPRKRVA